MKRFRSAFIAGLLVLLPVVGTVDLVLWLVHTADKATRDFLPFIPSFAGLGLLSALIFILATGFFAQNYFGGWVIRFFDQTFQKIHLVGGIYSSIKKFLETLLTRESSQFSGAVLVEFPSPGMYSLGFPTGKPDSHLLKKIGKPNLINVFVPCTPNPTSGFYIVVESSKIIPLDWSAQEAFRALISMGIVTNSEPPSHPAS